MLRRSKDQLHPSGPYPKGYGHPPPKLSPTLGNKNREMAGHGPSVAVPVRPAPPKSGAYCYKTKPTKPVGYKLVPSTKYKLTEPVCYGCGKSDHIRPNCPKERDKTCTAAMHMAKEEEDPLGNHLKQETPEKHPPVGPNEQEGTLLDKPDYPDEAIEGFGTTKSHYQWDEESPNNEEPSSFRASALRTLERGYCDELNDSWNAVMHYINSNDLGVTHNHSLCTC